MKPGGAVLLACMLLATCMMGENNGSPSNASAPGSSLPGLGGLSLGFEGPGYVEMGGSHSALTGNYDEWNDFYIRGTISGGRNVLNGEITREGRFGDSGWFGTLGLTRTLSENWYAQVSGGGSVGGFFLNRFSADGLINRKLLQRRQLVLTAGGGFDQSKTVNSDARAQIGAAYYFGFPLVLQGGAMWTHSNPGSILARTQYIAATHGYQKEHFLSLRVEWGREGYEVIAPPTALAPAFRVALNFPEHTITGTWRQWIGPNWGVNFVVEQHQEPAYHRIGGTAGVFLDF